MSETTILPTNVPDEGDARFDELQRRLVPLWTSIAEFNQTPQTIVVVPSLSLDKAFPGAMQQAYDERYLFLLLLLRQPRARLIYITSEAIHPAVIDYYLDLLPGVLAWHAKQRLTLLSPLEGSSRPLSQKLLERPRMIERIRSLIADPMRAHLVPFITTPLERDLAVALGIPMYGADPKHFHLGTKSGARQIFAEEGVPHPQGSGELKSLDEVVDALVKMRTARPGMREAVVKLNEGVSGQGNAMVDLGGAPAPGAPGERAALLECVRKMQFESSKMALDWYADKLAERGGIVEERIVGRELRSPSAQLRITPLGEVEMLSTHDQRLGGPSGQSYLGCRFPADLAYAPAIMREALKVGRRLMREGVLGRFALDFVAVRNDRNDRNDWDCYAIEINLRKGGTTHPFLTLQFLTDGRYDSEQGVFRTPRGESKYFVASDHVESPAYRRFTHEDLFDLGARHGLHFDQSRQTGVVFHMMNAIGEYGVLGLTAVSNSHEEAEALYQQAIRTLDEEAALAAKPAGA